MGELAPDGRELKNAEGTVAALWESDGPDVGMCELAAKGCELGNTEGRDVAVLSGNDGPNVGLGEFATKECEVGNAEGRDVGVLWGTLVGGTCGSAAGVDVEPALGEGDGIDV